jgi:hypothetical protein
MKGDDKMQLKNFIENNNIKIGGYYKMKWNNGNEFIFTNFN